MCPAPVQESLKAMYEDLGAEVNWISNDYHHLWPIDREVDEQFPQGDCAAPLSGWTVNCQDDLAGDILSYLYGKLEEGFELKPRDYDWQSKGVLRRYAQWEFLGDHTIFQGNLGYSGFDEYGYVYYPTACTDGTKKCKLHVYMHGCGFSAKVTGQDLVRFGGFLEYAASNDIIVVFPQAVYNYFTNMFMCFSFDGSMNLDPDFYNKNGVQPSSLKRMLDRATSPIDPSTDYLANNIAASDWGFEVPTTSSLWFITLLFWNFGYFFEVGTISCLVIACYN